MAEYYRKYGINSALPPSLLAFCRLNFTLDVQNDKTCGFSLLLNNMAGLDSMARVDQNCCTSL